MQMKKAGWRLPIVEGIIQLFYYPGTAKIDLRDHLFVVFYPEWFEVIFAYHPCSNI
jgi:hypothetical protein